MDWGVLATDIKTDIYPTAIDYRTKKEMITYSPQTTTTRTFSPTTAYESTYAPQLILNSPSANATTKKEGMETTPSVSITPTQSVAPSQSDQFKSDSGKTATPEDGGMVSDATGLLMIGGIVVGGYFLIKTFSKKKGGLF